MHRDTGWKAFIKNQQVNYDAHLGILPAILGKGAGQ